MKKIVFTLALLGVTSTAFAAPQTCSAVLSSMATSAQQQVAVSKQIDQQIDSYKFIPDQQRAVLKRDAAVIAKNAEKNTTTLKTMAANKQIGDDACVGMGNDTIGMMNNTLAINKALLNTAQTVQTQRDEIIKKSQCNDEVTCNKALYEQFGKLIEPVLQKNLNEMATRAQKMGLVQPTNAKVAPQTR